MICGGSVVEAMLPIGCLYSEHEILELFVLGQLVGITDQQLRPGQQSLGLWVGFSWGPHEGHCHGSFGRSHLVSVYTSTCPQTQVCMRFRMRQGRTKWHRVPWLERGGLSVRLCLPTSKSHLPALLQNSALFNRTFCGDGNVLSLHFPPR